MSKNNIMRSPDCSEGQVPKEALESWAIIRKKPIPFEDLSPVFAHRLGTSDYLPYTSADGKQREMLEKAWERWQAVRAIGYSSGGLPLTGYEPYCLDLVDPDAIASQVSTIGQEVLKGWRLRVDPILRQKLYHTLTGESMDIVSAFYLNTLQGSLTARLRAEIWRQEAAKEFKGQTERAVSQVHDSHKYQKGVEIYRIPNLSLQRGVLSEPQTLYSEKEMEDPSCGYGFMSMLGKIGCPTLRTWFNLLTPPDLSDLINQLNHYLH